MTHKKFKKAGTISGLVAESALAGVKSLGTDRFRTFLSLTGVSIGIFSIVAVLCTVDALKRNIDEGLNSFSGDMVYIQKWPLTENDSTGTNRWWEYRLRPEVTEEEYAFLKENSRTASGISYLSSFPGTVLNRDASYPDGLIIAASSGLEELLNPSISAGRWFTDAEAESSSNSVIIGHDVAEALFPGRESPIGKEVKINGSSSIVIGVLEKQGRSLVSMMDWDHAAVITLTYGRTVHKAGHTGQILAAPKAGISQDAFKGELRQLIRSHRRLRPSQKDDFAVNSMSFLVDSMAEITDAVKSAGWLIAAFSLLIGGFGIANIMFVSVKERTRQIGIRKALGSPRYVIMTQFMTEASVLSMAGGAAGITLVYLATVFFHPYSFLLILSPQNAAAGLLTALITGLASGMIPAAKAAMMKPVDAINA